MATGTATIGTGDNAALEGLLSEGNPEAQPQEVFADPNKFFAFANEPDEEPEVAPAEEQEVAASAEGAEDAVEEPVADETEPEAGEQTVQGSRAQKRIQALAQEKKRLAEQLSGIQTQFQTFAQQQAQQLAMQQQLAEQRATMLQEKLEAQQAEYNKLRSALDRTEEEGLSDLEKYERKLQAQFLAKAKAEAAAEVEPLKKELEATKKERARIAEEFKRRTEIAKIRKEASAARAEALYTGFDEEEAAKNAEAGDALVLTWSAAYGQPPAEAAKQLKAYLDWYADARAKSRVKAKATPQQAAKPTGTKKLPASPAGSVEHVAVQRSTTGLPVAPREQLRANGYNNYFEWQKAGFPALRNKAEG